MDHIYGNVSLPDMGKGADSPYSPDCHNSPQYSPGLTGSKGNVSTSRGLLLLSLALSVGLLFTLAGLIAVAYLYSNAQTKLDQIEALHKNLSATLNTTATSGCRVCPDGWAHNSGKCYLFSSTRKTWSQSRDHCITLGGHLAIVNSQEEQYFLSKRAIEDFYWMGLSDLETEGQWIWVDSTETGAVFWKKGSDGQGEPDNWKKEDPAGENCALFTKSGHWLDNSCKKRHTFVCETVATD
ncbi:CD209 antigen-like protein E [Clupea harengus]|uniref:CD209 antigen-like protein E n=1 Tax=Clupea harengus TaxID=7950 RepID=A0A8M1KED2_CLUHA|nr:CD209 antigen-like protein E [Clupea harengus]